MTNKEWIESVIHDRYESGVPVDDLQAPLTRDEAYYERFLDEQSSTMSRANFKKLVSHVKMDYLRSKGNDEDFEGSVGDSTGQFEFSYSEDNPSVAMASGKVEGTVGDPEDIAKGWGVDLNVWQIADFRITQQTVHGEVRTGKLTFNEGKLDGHLEYGGRVEKPVYNIRMNFVRREFDKLFFEPIRPINIGSGSSYRVAPEAVPNVKYKRALIISDSQNGFKRNEQTGELEPMHDRKWWDLTVSACRLLQPHLIIINGDMLDLTEWSDKFIQGPEFSRTTQPALLELYWWLRRIRLEVGQKTRIIYHEGNHEYRIVRAIQRNQQAAYGLRKVTDLDGFPTMSIPHLLSLDDLGIEWKGDYPRCRTWLGNVCVSHGEKTNLRNMLSSLTHIEVIGHTHHVVEMLKTIHTKDGIRFAGVYSTGTGARLDEQVPSNGSRSDWQQAFACVTYSDNVPFENVEMIKVTNGYAVINGRVIEAVDRTEEIRKDIDWEGF